jgi:hypothetical protein
MSATSAAEISCTSTPQYRLNADTRRYSSSRSASVAISMNPTGLNPVARPVSASSRLYSALVYLRISVEVSDVDPNVTMSPAACHVVPEVRRSRSSSTTSRQPACARWYATDVPMMPPPTTTTRAREGKRGSDMSFRLRV